MKHHSSRVFHRNAPPAHGASNDVRPRRRSGSPFIPQRRHSKDAPSRRVVVNPPQAFLAAVSRAWSHSGQTDQNAEAGNSNMPAAEPGVGAVGIGKTNWIIDCTPLDICVVQHTGGIAARPVIWTAIDRFTHLLVAAHIDLKGGQS